MAQTFKPAAYTPRRQVRFSALGSTARAFAIGIFATAAIAPVCPGFRKVVFGLVGGRK